MNPHSLDSRHVVMSYFTLGRDHPFEDRLAIASAAGFDGIGLYIGEYQKQRALGRSAAELQDLVASFGLCVAEIEVVRLASSPELEATAWEMADTFGSRYLQVIGPHDATVADAGRHFARICDEAADHGLVCGIEFLPFTNVRTAAEAMRIVEAADRPNGGVCVDIWHHKRGANDRSMIAAIPADRIMAIQMSDGPAVPRLDDYYNECLRNRDAPGTGAMGAVDFVRLLRSMGANVPWSLEVCNDDSWTGHDAAAAHAVACADGMRAVLTAAGL